MRSNPHKLTKEQDQEIAKLHIGGMKIADIARMFNVVPGVIRVSLRYEGVDVNPHFIHIREDAFDEIKDEETAYWLGFIYADGYVAKAKFNSYAFSVKLKESDRNHLEKLRRFLDIEKPVHEVRNKTRGIARTQVVVRSSNKKICLRLIDLGINVGRTSPMSTINSVPNHLIHHFFRGIFDGDGCAHKIPGFTFLSQKEILDKLRSELIEKSQVSDVRKPKDFGKIYRIDYGGFQQAIKVKNYLYRDATIFMQRKLDVINSWTRQTSTELKRKYYHKKPISRS